MTIDLKTYSLQKLFSPLKLNDHRVFCRQIKTIAVLSLILSTTACGTLLQRIPGMRSSKKSLVMVAVGDVNHTHTSHFVEEFRALGKNKYSPTRPVFRSADFSFVNLETPYTTAEPIAEKQFPFATDPEELDHILWAGFNLLSLANNHSADAGYQGVDDTLQHLEKRSKSRTGRYRRKKIIWGGTGRSADAAKDYKVFSVPGKDYKLAFICYGNSKSEYVNTFELQRALIEVKEMRENYPDAIIIISIHSGKEYRHVPGPQSIHAYRSLIDSGASIILGHHPHVVQGIEHYRNGIICYSLGNFSFGSYTERHIAYNAKLYGMITAFKITRRGDYFDVVLHVYPMYLDNVFPLKVGNKILETKPFVPSIVKKPFSDIILQSIQEWCSKIPKNKIVFAIKNNYMTTQFKATLNCGSGR